MAICAELRNFARMNNKIKFLLLYILAAFPLLASAQYTDELCEDSCDHIHGIDISHYQGSVFWEAIGNNSKMAYVYMKATEGGDRIDHMYEEHPSGSPLWSEGRKLSFLPSEDSLAYTIEKLHDAMPARRSRPYSDD